MDVEIRRSNRKTLALEVTADLRVLVRAPLYVSRAKIEQFVWEKRDWIAQSLQKARRRMQEKEALPRLTQEEQKALAKKARAVFSQKAAYYAPLVGVDYGKITIRSQKTRWGSCSAKGNLNFNCLLLLAPEKVQDYVVVHELCHRKEMNHSAGFWQEVAGVMPEYKEYRRWLKEHGSEIMDRSCREE